MKMFNCFNKKVLKFNESIIIIVNADENIIESRIKSIALFLNIINKRLFIQFFEMFKLIIFEIYLLFKI